MADVHFQIAVDNRQILLSHLDANATTLVDGNQVQQQPLVHGNRIEFGQTIIEVMVEAIADEPAAEEPDVPAVEDVAPTLDLVQRGKTLEFSPAALELAEQTDDPQSLLAELKKGKHWNEAIRLQASLLSEPQAVLWIAGVIKSLAEIKLPEDQQVALETARDWAQDPTEERRRHCEQQAEKLRHEGIGGLLALAVFFSGGSIAPVDAEQEVLPDAKLFSRFLAAIVQVSGDEFPPDRRAELPARFLDQAPVEVTEA